MESGTCRAGDTLKQVDDLAYKQLEENVKVTSKTTVEPEVGNKQCLLLLDISPFILIPPSHSCLILDNNHIQQ